MGKIARIKNTQLYKQEILGIPLIDWGIFLIISLLWLIGEYFLFEYHFFPLTRGETDGIEYMELSQGPILQINPYHGPGYPFLIRIIKFLPGLSIFSAAKLATIVAGSLFLLSTFLLFSKLMTSHEEVISTILFLAINGVFLTHSNLILSDIQSAALFFASLATLLFTRRNLIIGMALSGFLAGLAYLTRYIFFFMIIIPIIWFIINPIQENYKRRFLSIFSYYLAFIIAILPWSIYLFFEMGNPFWNMNYLNIAFKMYRNGQGWNVFPTPTEFPNIFSVVFSNFKLFIYSWLTTFLALPKEILKTVPIIGLFSITGLPLWLRSKNGFRSIILLILLFYGALESLVWHEARFLLIFIPLFIALAVSGIKYLCSVFESFVHNFLPKFSKAKGLLFYFICVILVVTSALKTFPITPFFSDQSIEYIKAIDWLKTQKNVNMVFSAKPHIPFFVNAKWISFRDFNMQTAELSDLPQIIDNAKPEYLIFDERYSGVEFPQFSNLLVPELNPFPQLLTPVYKIDQPFRLIIYKVNTSYDY